MAKEDKHTNLIRGRAMKAAAQAAASQETTLVEQEQPFVSPQVRGITTATAGLAKRYLDQRRA